MIFGSGNYVCSIGGVIAGADSIPLEFVAQRNSYGYQIGLTAVYGGETVYEFDGSTYNASATGLKAGTEVYISYRTPSYTACEGVSFSGCPLANMASGYVSFASPGVEVTASGILRGNTTSNLSGIGAKGFTANGLWNKLVGSLSASSKFHNIHVTGSGRVYIAYDSVYRDYISGYLPEEYLESDSRGRVYINIPASASARNLYVSAEYLMNLYAKRTTNAYAVNVTGGLRVSCVSTYKNSTGILTNLKPLSDKSSISSTYAVWPSNGQKIDMKFEVTSDVYAASGTGYSSTAEVARISGWYLSGLLP